MTNWMTLKGLSTCALGEIVRLEVSPKGCVLPLKGYIECAMCDLAATAIFSLFDNWSEIVCQFQQWVPTGTLKNARGIKSANDAEPDENVVYSRRIRTAKGAVLFTYKNRSRL